MQDNCVIRSAVKEFQSEYYEKISECLKAGKSYLIIEFILKMIDKTLGEVIQSIEMKSKNVSEQVNMLLDVMEKDISISANEIMKRLGVKSKETLRGTFLNPVLENGLIRMTIPDKMKSKNQMYVK